MDTIIQTGQPAPDFELLDLQGEMHRLNELRGQIVVLNFWSAECPWAERGDQMIEAYRQEWGKNVTVWLIASNVNRIGRAVGGDCRAARIINRAARQPP